MAIETELEPSLEQSESSDDEQFIEGLVARLLPRVEDSYEKKSGEVAHIPKEIIAMQDREEPNTFSLGGNIEHQQASGLTVIKDLKDKLKLMNNSPIDLQNVDYSCLIRVLSFLQRRGEDWDDDLDRLRKIEEEVK